MKIDSGCYHGAANCRPPSPTPAPTLSPTPAPLAHSRSHPLAHSRSYGNTYHATNVTQLFLQYTIPDGMDNEFGFSLELSGLGNHLVTGTRFGGNDFEGEVRVYARNEDTDEWQHRGPSIFGRTSLATRCLFRIQICTLLPYSCFLA
jgi:hypothetical protein